MATNARLKRAKLGGGVFAVFSLLTAGAIQTAPAYAQHPNPEPRPGFSTTTTEMLLDGSLKSTVITPTSLRPVLLNELDYVQSNMFDSNGNEMVNTLPSTPSVAFNLHDGPVTIKSISKTSPRQDLESTLNAIKSAAGKGSVDLAKIQFGIDVLEGNPIDRTYSGIPMLHYNGPEKLKAVTPIFDENGVKIGGNVTVRQFWWDGRIEADTAMIDPTDVQDVPWTVTYVVNVLNGGTDDFSPFTMFWDDLPDPVGAPNAYVETGDHGPPHVAMDSTFYPMGDGKQFTIKVKHPPAKYYNLTYTWGWRIHPPRVQVMENALKKVGPGCFGGPGPCLRIPEWETMVFGTDPRANKAAAIGMIGELAPAKRMWQALNDAKTASPKEVVALMDDALLSLRDWNDRRHLPRGVTADPTADLTMIYLNNTLYGSATTFGDWKQRGEVFKVMVMNGDHFPHGYLNVDFGGSRGWENQFQFAGGPGGSHTFGRVHWWITAGMPGIIAVMPVGPDGAPSRHLVEIKLNFDPSDRLRLYQFDPLHHDVAVYSIH